jgi:hypothetical protein
MDIANDSTSIFDMPIGQSLTGIEYTPNINSKIALKLIVAGILRDSTICSYNAVFSVAFGNNGVDSVSLKGNVRFMAGLDLAALPGFPDFTKEITESTLVNWSPPSIEASLKGYFSITFKTTPLSVDGRFGIYLRAGTLQQPIIYGEALAELHIDENEWYFNLGRIKSNPKGRANLTLDIAILTVQVKSYLNIGTGIPPIPEPPSQIKKLFGNVNSPDASLGWGTGFAFGSAVDVKLDLDIIVGSVKLNAGFGYDLSLKRYNNAICSNTGSELGINGWYATGQAYLYVIGQVKLPGCKAIKY